MVNNYGRHGNAKVIFYQHSGFLCNWLKEWGIAVYAIMKKSPKCVL